MDPRWGAVHKRAKGHEPELEQQRIGAHLHDIDHITTRLLAMLDM
jgi:hypothetical protein